MIKAKRLAKSLEPQGFELVWEFFLSRQIHLSYCRPSPADGVFEHIRVEAAGKRGEAVSCSVVITPLRAQEFGFKPCPRIDDVLTELAATGSDRGYAEIESKESAIAWEGRVAKIGPERVRGLAKRHADPMSQSTANARDAAREYVRRIRKFSDETVLEYLAVQLSSARAPAKGQAEPFPGLMICQGDLRDAQECAALGIAMFGAEVDPQQKGFVDDNAKRSTDYKLRAALIADLLRNGA